MIQRIVLASRQSALGLLLLACQGGSADVPASSESRCVGSAVTVEQCAFELARASGEPAECEKLPPSERRHKDDCLVDVAQQRSEPNICLMVRDQGRRASCLLELAIELRSVQACSIDPTSLQQDWCRRKVAELVGNVDHCLMINDTKQKIDCVNAVVDNLHDPSLCAKLSDIQARELCAEKLAVDHDDPAGQCGTVQDLFRRNRCLANAAVRNPSLCDKLTAGAAEADQCYQQAFRFNGGAFLDSTTCNGLPGIRRDECIASLAIARKDPLQCSVVRDLELRGKCLGRLRDDSVNACTAAAYDFDRACLAQFGAKK